MRARGPGVLPGPHEALVSKSLQFAFATPRVPLTVLRPSGGWLPIAPPQQGSTRAESGPRSFTEQQEPSRAASVLSPSATWAQALPLLSRCSRSPFFHHSGNTVHSPEFLHGTAAPAVPSSPSSVGLMTDYRVFSLDPLQFTTAILSHPPTRPPWYCYMVNT
ncbi:hypothetical protein NDU88_001137 [Pleurodeles waltl]|uniref:Uncharacterized protein n=1 Tax=Pleurodeles waltl TaxID=8319 RepID=A0AAV7VY52_PLEWA|nr:hypothetical protein NDU88_001137 [Pleurodeles waltl]